MYTRYPLVNIINVLVSSLICTLVDRNSRVLLNYAVTMLIVIGHPFKVLTLLNLRGYVCTVKKFFLT